MAMEQREQTGGNHPYALKKKDGPGVVLTFKRNFQKNIILKIQQISF